MDESEKLDTLVKEGVRAIGVFSDPSDAIVNTVPYIPPDVLLRK